MALRKLSWIAVIANFLLVMISNTLSQPLISSDCPDTTVFHENSQYETNLNTLFLSLASNATNSSGHSTASIGKGTDSAVYGQFLCRGDETSSSCQNCFTTATTYDLQTHCPNRKVAILWYDQCMIYYSNESFLGRVVKYSCKSLSSSDDTGRNMSHYMEVVASMMKGVARRAANGGLYKKFATANSQISSSQTIYGLAQCTPDISADDCNRCLMSAVDQFQASLGARILVPSCNLRYEIYPFFEGALNSSMSNNASTVFIDPTLGGTRRFSATLIVSIVATSVVVVLMIVLLATCFCFFKLKRKMDATDTCEDQFMSVDSLQYDLEMLELATDKFSPQNKLGEGGFGSVYKGVLSNGKVIAVKRLYISSNSSNQGVEEFKNEVLLVAKLQHRNLVRLVGFCLAGSEKLLVYEYVPNKSLDHFLFDAERQPQLDWKKRYKIIVGIARGIVYLHHDSRLRIVHRDLKASNILVDSDMNPKVSDFGTARIFGIDQSQDRTSRVAGT